MMLSRQSVSMVSRQDRRVRSTDRQVVRREERMMLAGVLTAGVSHRVAADHAGAGDEGHHVLIQTLDRHCAIQTRFYGRLTGPAQLVLQFPLTAFLNLAPAGDKDGRAHADDEGREDDQDHDHVLGGEDEDTFSALEAGRLLILVVAVFTVVLIVALERSSDACAIVTVEFGILVALFLLVRPKGGKEDLEPESPFLGVHVQNALLDVEPDVDHVAVRPLRLGRGATEACFPLLLTEDTFVDVDVIDVTAIGTSQLVVIKVDVHVPSGLHGDVPDAFNRCLKQVIILEHGFRDFGELDESGSARLFKITSRRLGPSGWQWDEVVDRAEAGIFDALVRLEAQPEVVVTGRNLWRKRVAADHVDQVRVAELAVPDLQSIVLTRL